jgi:hypothetical protein
MVRFLLEPMSRKSSRSATAIRFRIEISCVLRNIGRSLPRPLVKSSLHSQPKACESVAKPPSVARQMKDMSNKAASKKQTGKDRRKKQSIFASDGRLRNRPAGPEVGGDSLRNQPLKNFPMKKLNLLKPEAIELSKLAAILCLGAETGAAMKRAMERAMKFYVEASLFVSDSPDDSDALMRYASDERWRERAPCQSCRPTCKKLGQTHWN